MHPAKPSTDMTPPTTTNSHTGSRPPRSVSAEMLERTPCAGQQRQVRGADLPTTLSHTSPTPARCLTFSPQAQRPIARNRAPSTCKGSSKELRAGSSPRTLPAHPSPVARAFGKPVERGRSTRAVNRIWGSFPSSQEHIPVLLPHRTQPGGLNPPLALGWTSGAPSWNSKLEQTVAKTLLPRSNSSSGSRGSDGTSILSLYSWPKLVFGSQAPSLRSALAQVQLSRCPRVL